MEQDQSQCGLSSQVGTSFPVALARPLLIPFSEDLAGLKDAI